MAIRNSGIDARRPQRKQTRHRRAHELMTLQQLEPTLGALGGSTKTYTDLGDRYAQEQPINGREFFAQSGERAEVTTRLRFRYCGLTSQLTPEHRLTNADGEIYNIKSVIDPDNRHKEIICMCVHDAVN